MPLSPAPLLPGMSPLPTPGQRPPDRRAVRLGALAALPIFLVAAALGQLFLPQILFLAPGLQAQAGGGEAGSNTGLFQGFVFSWTRRQGTSGGYNTPASLRNMQSEAKLFHMNAVIIPVVADMPHRSTGELSWHSTDSVNKDTLPDADYEAAIRDAEKANLLPILELVVKQQDPFSASESSTYVGEVWSTLPSTASIGLGQIGVLESTWFDNYTAFAVHYAQMAQRHNLPYFIIGDRLTSVTYDTSQTTRQADPAGIPHVQGEAFSCAGRRECEWRHVIQAVRSAQYVTIVSHRGQTGGNYTGKLIYAANWTGAPAGQATAPEFENIAWWNAVDYIGVDAYFPLTRSQADAPINVLQDGWHGKAPNPTGQGDIYGRLEKVADKFDRPIIFTAAGYASAPGAASTLATSTINAPNDQPDDPEQANDMQALLQTFGGTSWWEGAFWYADEPLAPRASQPGWATSSNWAGDTLQNSKLGGQMLNQTYQDNPLSCSCS